ncbi:hypothetical protein AB0K60_34685 [Thermopolyspora sp. NPDC052614]|uniref:hypothetical protein n=1 Tax=Thermopolyspora sp. NPDC052614 TaxID=3155682 RepID=UPI0034410E80
MINPLLFPLFGVDFWNSPIPMVILAVISAYVGWVSVEYIPFTRRILERREAGLRPRGENAEG